MAEIVMGFFESMMPVFMFYLVFGFLLKIKEQDTEYDASGDRTPLVGNITGTTSSNAGDYWASDYGDDGGLGE